MTGQLVIRSVTSSWPIHRKQLLDEVFTNNRHGTLHQVWVSRGHIFIALDQGRKLLTFDVKPVGVAQDYQFGNLGCLDLTSLHPPLVDVLFCVSLNSAITVQKNGRVQVWQFIMASYKWEKILEEKLCSQGKYEISNVCFLENTHTLYWCERQTEQNAAVIWKRDISRDGMIVFSEPVQVIKNIPICELSPLSRGIYASIRGCRDILGLVIHPHANRPTVSLYKKDGVHSYQPQNYQCLDFRDIILPHLSGNTVTSSPRTELFDSTRKHVLLISEGKASIITDRQGQQELKEVKCTMESVQTDNSTWFLYKDCVVQVSPGKIIFYNYHTGAVMTNDISETLPTSTLLRHTGPSLPLVLTESGLKTIQLTELNKSLDSNRPDSTTYIQELLKPQANQADIIHNAELVCKSFLQGSHPHADFAIDGKRFQNPALVLAMLDQLQAKDGSPLFRKCRSSIIESYSKRKRYLHTKYNEAVGPYISEYLHIEKLCSELFTTMKTELIVNSDCVRDEVLLLINPSSSLPVPHRQAHLEQLSVDYPEEVLLTLMQQLDIQSEDLSEEEMEKWRSVLLSENLVLSGYSGGTFSLYEIITRLLFLQKPNQLVNFVHIAQVIHDKTVGVSAFIRKRQTFQFYERALSGLPMPEDSRDVQGAVNAKAQLLIAMQTRSCLIKAVQLLLRYSQWENAIQVLKQKADNSPVHQEIFFIVLTQISQNGVLGKYCSSVLQYTPQTNSLLSVLDMIGQKGKGVQPISCPKDIFCGGPEDVELGIVKEMFLSMNSSYTN